MKTLNDLRRALLDVQREVDDYFVHLDVRDLYRCRPTAWAPIDDLAHLNLTTDLTARSLSLSREELSTRFGRADRPSRTYEAVRQAYLETLREGFRSPSRLVPAEVGTDGGEERRSRTLVGWRDASDALHRALEPWDEAGLDDFVIPHPALGALTVREMLFFTHIHALHHLAVAQRRVAGG